MNPSSNQPIGVVGAGLGGLAAACTLAARGYKVILFERNDWLGGKAAQLKGGGFRFDMGPTIVTMPSVLRRIFAEAGRRMEDYLNLVRLDARFIDQLFVAIAEIRIDTEDGHYELRIVLVHVWREVVEVLLIEPFVPIAELFRNSSVRIVAFQGGQNLVLIGEGESLCVRKLEAWHCCSFSLRDD